MKLNFKYIQCVLVASVLLFNLSCAKQESPNIDSGEVRTQSELDRLEACSLVNFTKGVLLHSNVILLFKCTKWSEEFPDMFAAIKRVQGSSWDHFMAPIDKEFIENLNRRDRVFKNIKDLDAKNGLDDLSRVLVALNETNFFDSVKAMFQCVDNSTDAICSDRQVHIPTKASLKNIIKIIDTDPETIDRASLLIKSLVKAAADNEEDIRNEVNKFKEDPLYIAFRLGLVDAIANKVKAGLKSDDRTFLSKVLLTGSLDTDVPWIYTWVHDQKMSRDKFRDLVEYPILTNPIFVAEIKGLKLAYDNGFSCSIKSSMDPNELLSFDFKTHFANYVTILRKRDYRAYYDYSSSTMVGLKMSSEVCQELQTNNYGVNFVRMLSNLSSFLGEKKFYDLMKFLVSNTTAKGDLDKTFAENLYLFDMVASDIFSSGMSMNEKIINKTRDFYPVVFDVAHKIPVESYIGAGELLQKAFVKENDPRFVGVSDFWSFFNSTEKNFVFNFVDRHFEGDTQFLLLLDFYTKFFDDLKDVQPVFEDKWMGTEINEEMSYLSLQDFFYQFAGRETLLDFKKFFSRNQILAVLEIISNGSNINASAREELAYRRSDEYVTRSRTEKYSFDVYYDPGTDTDYSAAPVIECMKIFAGMENGFYQLVRRLPETCSKVTNENIAFRLFSWLNTIEDTYKEFNPGKDEKSSLLSQDGILSPYMLNTVLGTTKILDSVLGDLDSKLPTKNGIKYLMSSTRFHLEDQKAAALIDKNLAWLSKWLNTAPEINTIHRNAILKKFSSEQNFSLANDVSKNVATLLTKYGDWVKNGNLAKAQARSIGEYDPAFDCLKVINQVITPNPCPSKEIVKKHTNLIMKYLGTAWEEKQGTGAAQLIKAFKPGEGLDIPLDGKRTSKYRMTLKETFKYLYDTSDRTIPINNTKTYYVNEQGKASTENLTILERIEIVIRDVRFDHNYLGVAFVNAVTKADDYNDEVEKRRKQLAACVKIPGIRCSKPMGDDELRMAKNAVETFYSLLDVNNGRGLDPKFTYGNYLKTFEQTLVASSAKAAQVVQLFALKDELLLQHNGRVLGEMTGMNMWSNFARVIRDRVGRKPKEFENFVNSEDFNRVDKALLYGFDLPQSSASAERLLKKLQVVPKGETQNAVENTIDWAASLDYNQSRLVEDTVAKLLLVGSYLGTPDVVFGTPNDSRYSRFKNNNLLQVFLALEKLVDYYPTIKNFVPADMKFIDAFKPINNALVFLTESLGSTKTPEKNVAYLVLNDVFNVFQTVMFDDLPNPSLADSSGKTVEGLDLLLGFLQNPKNVYQSYVLVRDDYRYLDTLHANQGLWFKSAALNISRVAESKQIDLTPLRDYLSFTTKNAICLEKDSNCHPNYHYDEAANLAKYLALTSKTGDTYFQIASRKLLVENFDQLNAMIEDLLPALRIKEVKPPLRFN